MKEFFLPSGESFLPGDYENLLKTMQRADGELCEPSKFRCVMYFPEWNKIVRFKGVRISFVMQCKCVESKGGYRITYRTLPGMSAVFLYVTCVLLCIIGLATLSYDKHVISEQPAT